MPETVRDVAPAPAVSPPALAGERTAGAVLLRGGPFVGLALAVVVAAGAALVPFGLWRPAVVLPVILVGLALAWRLCRLVPVRPVPVWTTVLAVLFATAEGVWAAATHAEHVILRRDAGSYGLYAQWIATRHGLPVQAHLEAFGGAAALAVPGFTLESPAYYQVVHGAGAEVVPQFLVGAPAVYSLGWWAGGWAGLLLMPAVAGALAIFAAASLAARLVGPRWAPVAAISLATAFPVLLTARSTYSEPVALVLLLAAAIVIADATVDPVAPRALGLVGGLTLGLAGLVRVDVLTEVALLLPVAAVLALRRHPAAAGLSGGVLAGAGAAAVSALLVSRPYLQSVQDSLVPLAAAAVLLAAICGVAVAVGRWRATRAVDAVEAAGDRGRGPGPRAARILARTVAGLILLLGAALATRPLWQRAHLLTGNGADFVGRLQTAQHLSVDGTRSYDEWSLAWVAWWLGPVIVLLAWVAFAALAARAVGWLLGRADRTGPPPAWLAPAVVGFGASLLTLWRPGITPDHPWADRRLVPVLLPTVVIAATGGVAWGVRQARRRFPAGVLGLLAVTGVVGLALPPLIATAPLAGRRTEQGELAAVRRVCAALRPGDAVLAVGDRGANEWPQVIRGVCDRPAAALRDSSSLSGPTSARASVAALAELVRRQGGRLVLLAADEDRAPDQTLAALGLQPRKVVDLVTREDARVLAWPPTGTARLEIAVWLAPWEQARSGAATP